jgi:hypothetical protein
VFNSFLRIQQTGSESGYNTSVDFSQLLDDKKGIFTHALELKDVPVVSIGNVNYREFVLDANQKDNKPYLSLNQIQLFQSNADVGLVHTVLSADNTHEAVISFPSATNIFSLNSRNVLQYEIQINYGHGSGSGDMFFYVEDSLFDPNQKYVTLFSQFGNPSGYYASNAGFEEWGVKQADCVTTPEPAAVIVWTLLGVCFVGLAVVRRHWNAKS